jgi:cell division protease FtsH
VRSDNRLTGSRTWIALLAVLGLYAALAAGVLGPARPHQVQLSYTDFESQVQAGNVRSVSSTGSAIQGTAWRPVPDSGNRRDSATSFQTQVPAFAGGGLEPLLERHHVSITASPETPAWVNVLIGLGPVLVLALGFTWLLRRSTATSGSGSAGPSGLFGFGRTQARLYDAERPATTFAEVAGIEEARAELQEVADFLREPQRYQRLGGTVPKGVLLVGLPGTGKTLLARAIAGEAHVPFFSVNASEFVEMIVGVGASRVRDLFEKARQAAPAIVFIDEIDAIGRSRGGADRLTGHAEQEQTLNQILAEMDGFDSRQGVIVIAATNRVDVLDRALMRPGRFDRQVVVQPPDRNGRLAILRIHTDSVPLDPTIRLDVLASGTPGLVGADLRNLVNEAALLAARRGRDAVTGADFDDALAKVLLGAERHIALSQAERERIAYHESGHALLGLLVPGSDPVRSVSIIPRGRTLGATLQSPVDDRFHYPEDHLRARIVGALGGRAAEQVVYGTTSTGAENDLTVLTRLAREMVTRWGMSPRLGPLDYTAHNGDDGITLGSPHSPATAELIDAEVRRIVEESFETACGLLRDHRDRLEALARALLGEETLDEEAVVRVTGLPQPVHLA